MLTGLKDADLNIMKHFDDRTLLSFCVSNPSSSYVKNLCANENFWRNRFVSKYGEESTSSKSDNKTWKNFYLQIISYLSDSKDSVNDAMVLAIEKGHEDLVNFFIKQGAIDFDRGLYSASKTGDKKLVDFFLQYKPSIQVLNGGLRSAAIGGHKNIAEYLIQKGANDWDLGLIGAAEGGHRDLIKMFVNRIAANWANDPDWTSALYYAALKGHKNLAIEFLNKGGRIETGLGAAIQGGHRDLINYFLSRGAQIQPGYIGAAATGHHLDLIEWLMQNGSDDPNIGLSGSAEGGHRDLIDFFIGMGANNFNDAMCSAALGGHKDLVEFFIGLGADDFNRGIQCSGSRNDLLKLFNGLLGQ